jgi:hypothetical protein
MKKQSPKTLKNKAWKLFSEYIRRRDADEGGTLSCITCGKLMHWKEAHAGHAIPGRTNSILLDPEVTYGQCPVCNIWKNGNYPVYTTVLIKKFGMDWWEQKLIDARKAVKMTRSDWEQAVEYWKAKLAGLEEGA